MLRPSDLRMPPRRRRRALPARARCHASYLWVRHWPAKVGHLSHASAGDRSGRRAKRYGPIASTLRDATCWALLQCSCVLWWRSEVGPRGRGGAPGPYKLGARPPSQPATCPPARPPPAKCRLPDPPTPTRRPPAPCRIAGAYISMCAHATWNPRDSMGVDGLQRPHGLQQLKLPCTDTVPGLSCYVNGLVLQRYCHALPLHYTGTALHRYGIGSVLDLSCTCARLAPWRC